LRLVAAILAALAVTVGCTSGTTAPSPAGVSDWPTYRGDLARDGHPGGVTLNAEQASHLAALWTRAVGGAIDGTPIVFGGSVIVATESGTIASFDLSSGAPGWSRHGLGNFSGSPTVAGGLVVAGTLGGHLYAFGISDGHTVWDWRAPGQQPAIWASPAIYGETVLIGIASQYGDQPLEAGRVAGLALSTGRQKWIFCIEAGCVPGGGVWSSVAVDAGGRAFVGTGNPDDGVIAFDAETGKLLWATSLHEDAGLDLDVGATPIVATVGGREAIAVGSDGGLFDLLDAATGAVIWSRFLVKGSAVHGLIASPAFDGAAFYVPSASSPTGMFALDPATGAIQWEQITPLPVYSAPAVGSRVLIFGTGDLFGDPKAGSLVALSTTDGSIVWSYDAHRSIFSSPAIAGTTVLVGDTRGDLIAFRPA